jgi:hypothetical protein
MTASSLRGPESLVSVTSLNKNSKRTHDPIVLLLSAGFTCSKSDNKHDIYSQCEVQKPVQMRLHQSEGEELREQKQWLLEAPVGR